MICHNGSCCKDLTFAHLLFTSTCSRMNSPVNQTNGFFNSFLSDSTEITSCVYSKTIDLSTDTAAILNLLVLRSIVGCPGVINTFPYTRPVFARAFLANFSLPSPRKRL